MVYLPLQIIITLFVVIVVFRLTKKFKFLRHGIEGKLKGQIKSLLALGSVLVVSGLILVVSVILKLGEMI